jgi:tRNA(Ile)-lysidine synthetase-like protein
LVQWSGQSLKRRRNGSIVLVPGERVALSTEKAGAVAAMQVRLTGSKGRLNLGRYEIEWHIHDGPVPAFHRRRRGREWFDADRIGPVIELRSWKSGDRYQPLGLDKSARLQNLFVNARIPRERRREVLLATDQAGQIWWVDGLRIGEQCKVRPETKRFLEWKWRMK